MLIVFVIVVLATFLLLLFFLYNSGSSQSIVFEKEQELSAQKDKLKIAEKKFLQGKMNKNIFEKIRNDLEYENVLLELEIEIARRTNFERVEEKVKQLFSKFKKPTKYKRTKLKRMIGESESVRTELKIIEKKLLRNEISQETFEKLVQEKEKEMVDKETKIVHFIRGHE